MTHEMRLKEKYYNYILNGTKRIEIRLLDEKRQKIKIGDTIIFFKYEDMNEFFKAKVIDLLKYNSFEELINAYDIEILADKSMTKDELLKVFNEFYTKEEQKKYGIVGIKIEI